MSAPRSRFGRLLRTPLTLFLVVSLLLVSGIFIATNAIATRAATITAHSAARLPGSHQATSAQPRASTVSRTTLANSGQPMRPAPWEAKYSARPIPRKA